MTAFQQDSRRFRDALGTFTTGVTIVTTASKDGADVGLTVNSFTSVSLDPPLVLWCLGRASDSWSAFATATHYAVHVLAQEQVELSRRFASNVTNRFEDIPLSRGVTGVALIEGCCSRFECRIADRHDGGDHDILLGEVLSFERFDRAPLVYHGGRYTNLG